MRQRSEASFGRSQLGLSLEPKRPRILNAYVRQSVWFGLEFVAEARQLQRVNTRFFQWGCRLLMWPRGAPTAAVQGQLGWFDVRCSRLLSATGLWLR